MRLSFEALTERAQERKESCQALLAVNTQDSLLSSALASLRSGVSNPSVNHA